MEHPPPTGTLWVPEPPSAPMLALQSPPTPPVATKEEAPSAHIKMKQSLEAEKIAETNKILKLPNSEEKAFKELILRVQEALNNHEFSAAGKESKPAITVLLKFLKARNFNVGESFTMLKNTITWRREFGVDGPMEQLNLRDDLQKAVYVHGHDKEGHPVFYNAYGEFQNKELYMNTFADEDKRMNFVKGIIQMLERNIRKFDFSVAGVSTFLMVVDLKNAPGAGKKEIRIACDQLLKLLQDNYPEFIEKQVFINVPKWYLVFYSLIRPFLSDHTKDKFDFAGPSKAVDTLLKYISPENLPIQYGGLKSKYPYIRNPEFTADDAAKQIELKPLTKQTIEIFLDEKCAVSWKLKSSGPGGEF